MHVVTLKQTAVLTVLPLYRRPKVTQVGNADGRVICHHRGGDRDYIKKKNKKKEQGRGDCSRVEGRLSKVDGRLSKVEGRLNRVERETEQG